jgi:hypothetical protein
VGVFVAVLDGLPEGKRMSVMLLLCPHPQPSVVGRCHEPCLARMCCYGRYFPARRASRTLHARLLQIILMVRLSNTHRFAQGFPIFSKAW